LFEVKKFPRLCFNEHYMLNAWLAIDFLEKQNALTNRDAKAAETIKRQIERNKGVVVDRLKKSD